MRELFDLLRPRFGLPQAFPILLSDKIAFWMGTGLGIGFLRPASATWGSLLGMGYLILWGRLPGLTTQLLVQALSLWLSVWSAGRCEKLLGQKDPHPVVIDEIVALPFAFWPLLQAHEARGWVWIAAFCLYRAADVIKPWPARFVERFPGGVGIVADDVVSATYTGLLLFWAQHLTRMLA